MKDKLFGWCLWTFLLLVALLVSGGIWYYTLGRKPKLLISAPIASDAASPTSHVIAPGELLLIAGTKATLYDTGAGKEKWSSDLSAVRATPTPAPAIAPPSPESAKAEPTPDNHDPMRSILQSRLARHTAKMEAWTAQMNAKRATLNTPLKIANFKEEEAKYQGELAALKSETAALSTASAAMIAREELPGREDSYESGRYEVFSDSSAIWLVQKDSVRILDHANGRLTKEVPLTGNFRKKAMRGAGCLYLFTSGEDGGQQITRINATDGAMKSFKIASASAESHFPSREGVPDVQPEATEFTANGTDLLQLNARLIEEKIVERQALKSDSASDWDAADKNTSSGWSNDAAVFAQAIANDAQRETTGGKDYIDESTYEVQLRHPFNSGTVDGQPFRVQSRPDIFSTASFDLVVAGCKMLVFDHANKKLWDATLAYPLAAAGFMQNDERETGGTVSRPFLESEKHLYVFDRGFLNAFDRSTGKTLWRLPSVGIKKIQLDGNLLYVTSANASAETLRYSQQATAATLPVILKIDAGSGKILWKVEKYEECFVSSGNVYATFQPRNPNDLVDSVFQGSKAVATRFKVYKLSARDGQPQWEWFQTRRPLRVEADRKKVSLLFSDELQVLTSHAL